MADFETSGENQTNEDGFASIWGVGVVNVETEETVMVTSSMSDFMNWCSKDNQHHKTKNIYFHNLKFDGRFIVDYLNRNGFKHKEEGRLYAREYRTLISSDGSWYQIEVVYRHFGTRSVRVKFLDSLKKLPFSVERIGKAFKTGLSKGEIDYNKYRPHPYTITPEEEEYIVLDCLIVARALKIQQNQGLKKMTVGSDALSSFIETIGKRKYDYLFPELDIVVDTDLRKSYKGGWTYLSPRYKNKVINNVVSIDVNGLYSYAMSSPFMLPYGEPVYYEGEYEEDKEYPLYIQYILVDMTLKDDHLPNIQIKNNWRFVSTEYITTTNGEPVELCLTNVDLQIMLDHYNIHSITYLEGFKFRGIVGVFDDYIESWQHVKATSTGAMRELAKLMLNSLYGKFGTNPRRRNLIPYFDEESNTTKYRKSEETIGKTQYVPMASFITAYARETTIRTAQKLYPYFVYSDTDSIKVHTLNLEDIKKLVTVDDKKLGAWGYEGTAYRFKALRPKTYVTESIYNEVDIICAGLPKDARKNITFSDFTYGLKVDGKLQQRSVIGGVYLHNTTFEIKYDSA